VIFKELSYTIDAISQAVYCRPVTAEARALSPCGISGGQSGSGTYLSPSTSVVLCQNHPTFSILIFTHNRCCIIFKLLTASLYKIRFSLISHWISCIRSAIPRSLSTRSFYVSALHKMRTSGICTKLTRLPLWLLRVCVCVCVWL
jgi:hypothetical protein